MEISVMDPYSMNPDPVWISGLDSRPGPTESEFNPYPKHDGNHTYVGLGHSYESGNLKINRSCRIQDTGLQNNEIF